MSDDPKPLFPVASGKTMLLMVEGARGGVVFDAALAAKIGELLCEAHFGKVELERQKPFTAVDKGTYWQVDGSRNRDRKRDGPGAFFLSIEKYDGRITDFGHWWNHHLHPSVARLVKARMREMKGKDRK